MYDVCFKKNKIKKIVSTQGEVHVLNYLSYRTEAVPCMYPSIDKTSQVIFTR